jgi:hypothetical protein
MAGREAQLVLVQVPVGVQVPREQRAERVPVYPELHVGVQEVPEADPETQFPDPAFGIVGKPEQAVLVQVPEVLHTPDVHVAERVPE